MTAPSSPTRVAIACGGTGGHLFPGVAVGHALRAHGCEVALFVSDKEIDRLAVGGSKDFQVHPLASVGLTGRNYPAFLWKLWGSRRAAGRILAASKPVAVLAMGGFTGAGPILAGRRAGVATALHESNVVPGRANRWLARKADRVFVGFEAAASRLPAGKVEVTGTPVRAGFSGRDAAACRESLGLKPNAPVLLIMGGSQGARGVNDLVCRNLEQLRRVARDLQFLHLTGVEDRDRVAARYAELKLPALVRPFLSEMEFAMGAATLAISRAGASSLAEIAAARLPAVLVPYPSAADDHQYFNAKVFADHGAARFKRQEEWTAQSLTECLVELLTHSSQRESMQRGLAAFHHPDAAERIASELLQLAADRGLLENSNGATNGGLPARLNPSASPVS